MCYSHKLVLTITDKKAMTLASKRLLGKLKERQLFDKINWISKEPPTCTFRAPYLSIQQDKVKRIIMKEDDIVSYFENKSPKGPYAKDELSLFRGIFF